MKGKKKSPAKSMPRPKALLLLNLMKLPIEKRKPHPGRGGVAVSLAPLTANQALSAALQIKPTDLKRVEETEKRRKGKN